MGKIADKDNPYPGSRAFRQADEAFFFGREADTAAIIDLWRTNRLTVVSGPVASGKTSLLQAGVYPFMTGNRAPILPLGNLCAGSAFPFPVLADQNPFTFALLSSWSPDEAPTRLAGLSVSEFLRRFTQGTDGVTYAAIDQVDDLFLGARGGSRAQWRKQFLDEVPRAVDEHPRLHLLLLTRSEVSAPLTAAVGGGAQYTMSGLTERGAADAVIKPALRAGRTFTKEAASRLVNDLQLPTSRKPGCVEPSLLQAACRYLWDDLPLSTIDVSDRAIRGFDTGAALSVRCAQVIEEVAGLHDIDSRRLQSWLTSSFVTGSGTRDGADEGEPDTAGMPNAVPRSLLDRHLLTIEIAGSARYYRLLAPRLAGPLQTATVRHAALPTTADYLRAAGRELALGDLCTARAHGQEALGAAATLRERAESESFLGNVHHRRGKPGEALPHYRQAAELLQATRDTSAAASQLAAVGQLLLTGGQPDESLVELRAAADRTSNDPWLQTRLALALWQLGNGQAAVPILDGVLASDGGYAEALRARGEILADLGKDPQGAIADLERTVTRRPSSRAAHGLALAELGDHRAAAKEIDGAVADAPRSGLVLYYAARASGLAGDRVSARERAKQAIDAIDPPLSPAHKRQARELARIPRRDY
jgi:tetratricopeptide (TPR) repeat protein